MEVLAPNMIVEWIPYSNLKNIKYLIKDEFSEIYTADWIGGIYDEWDSNKKQLKRIERPEIQSPLVKVVLKKLINVKSASKSWFEEAKSYLTINGLFQSESDNLEISKASNLETNYTSSRLFTSKIHNFENLPEPRNATEEEQEEFHNKSNDSSIPDDINDLDGSNKQNGRRSSKVVNIFRAGSRRLSKVFKKLQINSNDDEKEIIQKEQDINIDDDDEIYKDPNLLLKEQDGLKILDG
ncbi:kinase-like domain-containing protein [Rhizophagus irregularis DAOM 181602=DAOM 197198]|nr:kinase-like domain-containing protein [Rhizophagus irregularis DAOM 181602=DAOM 197198]